MVSLFCAVNITGDIENFIQISILLYKTKIVHVLKKFFIFRVILKAQKKADHTLEMPGLFCDYSFIKNVVKWRLQTNTKVKDDFYVFIHSSTVFKGTVDIV